MSGAPEAGTRNLLVFSNSHYEDAPYDRWLAGTDIRPWLIVSEGRYREHAHIPGTRSFADYWHNPRIDQYATDLALAVPLTAIIARCEPDVLRAARLRDVLGLPGQDWSSAVAFRDKVVMKSLLGACGIDIPEFSAIEVATDLFEFIRRHGYPVVVKPTRGSGSVETHILENSGDLEMLLTAGLPSPAEVERFVEGSMYLVDGLVLDGHLAAAYPSRYINDCLSFRSTGYLGTVMLTEGDPLTSRLLDLTGRVLDGLPTPACTTFHLEAFHTKDDRLVVCEIASRTAGGMVPAVIRHTTGVDIDHAWFQAQLGLPTGLQPPVSQLPAGKSAGHVLIYPRVGTLGALPGEPPPFVAQSRITGQVGQRCDGQNRSGSWIAGFVLAMDTEATLESRVHETAAWFDQAARWELTRNV